MALAEKWGATTVIFKYADISNEEKWKFYKKLAEEDKSDEAIKRKGLYKAILVEDKDREALFNSFFDPNNKKSTAEITY